MSPGGVLTCFVSLSLSSFSNAAESLLCPTEIIAPTKSFRAIFSKQQNDKQTDSRETPPKPFVNFIQRMLGNEDVQAIAYSN